MKQLFFILFTGLALQSSGQNTEAYNRDTIPDKVVVFKDYRLDILARKEADINTEILKQQARTTQGFRLMILNTNNKDSAFKVRAELLQKFPEQKLYMWFANPYIRIKFGNFRTKEEAEVYRQQISKMLGGASIYFIPETIEVDPDDILDPFHTK